ncbi:MAG TPA: hypothetical protein PLI09_21390 [Candidatus Hydrogenedentes bacterium]|nr:hypothetical protein [Candidatus Hydrogenedentota bacterium]
MSPTECPICNFQVTEREENYGGRTCNFYNCPNCGRYLIGIYLILNRALIPTNKNARAILSASIWQRQEQSEEPPIVSKTHLDAAEKGALPDPSEQLDRLILFLGKYQESSGKYIELSYGCLRAKIGGVHSADELYIVQSAVSSKLIESRTHKSQCHLVRLTLEGWTRFRELQCGAITSRTAFMAMPFGNTEVTQIVEDVFRHAVEETGFRLKRLDDETPAGHIDDRMRVEILMCRFLIADLTCENRGAYWEAGYAEGLGKPVIYTCNKHYFESHGTHFDTNHRQTIKWDLENPQKAADDLKATIRATLPNEAKMPEE